MTATGNSHYTFGHLFVVVVLLVPACAAAQPQPTTPFRLTLSSREGKSEFLPLLPVVVTIDLTNNSHTTQSIAGALGVVDPPFEENFSRYCFQIERPDGTSGSVYLSDWVRWVIDAPFMANLPQSLGPGEAQILDYCLGYGIARIPDSTMQARRLRSESGAVFSKPGEYAIHLTLPRLRPAAVESTTLSVTIKEPENAADALAHDILARSGWPEMFLTPMVLYAEAHGIPLFDGPPLRRGDPTTTSPLDTCRQILTLCPDSAYAPFARMFLGTVLCRGWAEWLEGRPAGTVDVEKRLDGIQLLRQSLEDSNLPRRYHEQALLNLRSAAEGLVRSLQHQARQSAPTIESILGEPVPDVGIPWDFVFWFVSNIEAGKGTPGMEEVMRSNFTPEQYEALRNAVLTNSALATSAGVNPLQEELRSYSEWAGQELRKLPWRDPNTGMLSLRGITPSGGLF